MQERLAAIQTGQPLDGAAEPLKSVPATKDGRRLDESGKPKRRRIAKPRTPPK